MEEGPPPRAEYPDRYPHTHTHPTSTTEENEEEDGNQGHQGPTPGGWNDTAARMPIRRPIPDGEMVPVEDTAPDAIDLPRDLSIFGSHPGGWISADLQLLVRYGSVAHVAARAEGEISRRYIPRGSREAKLLNFP